MQFNEFYHVAHAKLTASEKAGSLVAALAQQLRHSSVGILTS